MHSNVPGIDYWKRSLIALSVVVIMFVFALNTLQLDTSTSTSPISTRIEDGFGFEPVRADLDQKQITDEDLLNEITQTQANFDRLEQSDPKLIRYVRARYLTPPPPPTEQSSLKPSTSKSGTPLEKWVRNFFHEKRNGIFLEAGANDGYANSSNTLGLELELGWTGVLIECNPMVTPKLRGSGRKAWLATVCLSTTAYPKVVNMSIPDTWAYSARLGPTWDLSIFGVNSTWSIYAGIETVPLYSILASVGIKEIDYFSFDIEGGEFSVLKSFPFDKVLIKVWILEVYFYSEEEKKELKTFLEKNGLMFIRGIQMDQIYVHQTLLKDGITVESLAEM